MRALKEAEKAWEQKQSTKTEQQKTSTEGGVEYSLSDNENIPAQLLHYTRMYSDAMNDPKIKELYEKAKNGDDEAAFELVNYCFANDFIEDIVERYKGCYFISVNGAQETSLNVMPIVIADVLSQKTGFTIFKGVFKISKNNMRGKSTTERLIEKVLFDTVDKTVYNNIKGKKFVIVDDTVSTGTTTNSLARYLENAGGQVSATISLFKGQDHYNNLAITKETLEEIERRIGREHAEQFIKEYGYADRLEQLTERQAQQLLRTRGNDERRRPSDVGENVPKSRKSSREILPETPRAIEKNSTQEKAGLNDKSAFSMPESGSFSLPEGVDEEYDTAVGSGDMNAAQRLVDEAAKSSGAILDEEGKPLKLYRGTKGGQKVFSKDVTHKGKIYTTDNINIASNYGDKTGKATAVTDQIDGEPTTYALYGFPKNMLTVDAQYGVFSDLLIPEELRKYSPDSLKATNAQIAEWAEMEGYDALRVQNVRDGGVFAWNDQYIFFDENLVKSADAVTKDNDGNIIPLSERFNEENNDIRYSLPDTDYAAEMDALDEQFKNNEISRDEYLEKVNELYRLAGETHGTIEKGETVTGREDFTNPVPKSVDGTKKVRRHVRTVIEGGNLTPEMLDVTKQQILSGDISYAPTAGVS